MTTDSLKSPALRHNSEYQSPHPPPRASLKPLSGIPKCRVNSQAPPPGAAAPPLCLPLQITLGHLSTEAQPLPESSCPQWDRRQHGSSLYSHCCQCLDLLFLSIQPLGPHSCIQMPPFLALQVAVTTLISFAPMHPRHTPLQH